MVIVAGGFVLAAASSVVAYRAVGPYGDGPLNVGLYRTTDPESGKPLVYREARTADGTAFRYHFDDATRALRSVHMTSRDGKTVVLPAASRSGKSGFSLAGNGVIDAWEYRDAQGRIEKIEVSRRQDGVVDRWEYYRNDQLDRVEEDEDRDGRVDRWLTYDAGILVEEIRDRDGDGKPDRRP